MVPKDIQHLYVTPHITLNQIFPYLKYQIIAMTTDSLKNIYTVTEGFENRLKSNIYEATDFHHFLVKLLKNKALYIYAYPKTVNECIIKH